MARKPTYKKVAGRKVQTNKLFKTDILEPWPDNASERLHRIIDGMKADLFSEFGQMFRAGIAIGRARATRSGKRGGR